MLMPNPGDVFRHWKGRLYKVICVARCEWAEGSYVVIYEKVDTGHDIPDVIPWARDLGEFMDRFERVEQ